MASQSRLQSVGLIEKDKNGDIMWVWSFPNIDPALRELLIQKCSLQPDEKTEEQQQHQPRLDYSYGHLANVWYYLKTIKIDGQGPLNKIVSFCVAILSKDFNPEKYNHLAQIFAQDYLSSGSPVTIVTHYLSVYTKGVVDTPPITCDEYSEKDYDSRRAYVVSPLREIIKTFGVESILLFNGLLLKKRVVVYSPDQQTLLDTCRALPQFVWHRQNWNIVYPDVSLEEEAEIDVLKAQTHYIAGFSDPGVEAHDDLYDVFIDVSIGTITVNPASKDSFGMTKIHKDIAMRLMECANDDEYSDQAIVKELSNKVKDLIGNLRKLANDDGKITLEQLKARKMTPATENLLYGLATAEGIAGM